MGYFSNLYFFVDYVCTKYEQIVNIEQLLRKHEEKGIIGIVLSTYIPLQRGPPMIKELVLIAGGAAIHGAGKVVKMTGEKINEIQKDRFEKVVEQNRNSETDHEQVWVEEEIIKKRKLLEEKVYHQYNIYTVDNQPLYRARAGIIKGVKRMEIHNGTQDKIAFIEATGDILSEKKRYPEYSIFIGGARADMAKIAYDGNTPFLELNHKKWKVLYDKNDIEKIIDADGFTLLDVEKKIAKRQLLNIYTDDQKLCVLLFLAGMLNELKEK